MGHAGKGGGRFFVNAARIHGRKSNFSLLEYIQSEIRAGESPVPPWLPATLVSPPITIPNVPHPGPITYPEDRLRKIWFERHPEARNIRLKTVYVGEHRYWQHPATSFVHRQSKLIQKGMSEEEAYTIVEEEDKQEQRYRDLERVVAIEQAKEMGFDGLETARDMLVPPDLSQARERMLEELIDLLKLKGIPNVVPELLPKGMKWKDVLAYLKKHPDHTPFFNLEFLATHAVLTGNAEMADAYMWIYGGQTLEEDDDDIDESNINEALAEEGIEIVETTDENKHSAQQREEEPSASQLNSVAKRVAERLVGVSFDNPDSFFVEDAEESSKPDEEEEMTPEQKAEEEAKQANIQVEAERLGKILQRIENIYTPNQFPPTEHTVWGNLVNLLALRPKSADVKLAQKGDELKKGAQKTGRQPARSSSAGAKPAASSVPPPAKGKESQLK